MTSSEPFRRSEGSFVVSSQGKAGRSPASSPAIQLPRDDWIEFQIRLFWQSLKSVTEICQHLHGCRFARAVGSQEGTDLTGWN